MNISPEIINEIFYFSKNSAYEISCGNCLSILNILHIFEIESIASITAKICDKVPNEIKETTSLTVFKRRVKNMDPQGCPYRLCKTFKGEVASMDLLIFIGSPNVTFF